MGGCAVDDGCNEVKTVVLVGRTGNGKSATGNSIIGKRVFDSKPSLASVTTTCELHSTVLESGQILNVIDTPGLFDSSLETEHIGKEIVNCIDMAKDGIHAVLVVLSLRNRFSREEASAIESLRRFFGGKIDDYMIVVFSGGDNFGRNVVLDDLLGRNCPETLAEVLKMCGNRRVLFDNVTEDEVKKSEQLEELLSLVNVVVDNNGGKPYSNELFLELKKADFNLSDQIAEVTSSELSEVEEFHKSYEKQLKRFYEMVESKLRETTLRLEKQLAEEKAARLEAEARAQAAQMKSTDKIFELEQRLESAHRETEELRKTHRESEISEITEITEEEEETPKTQTETKANYRCVIL